MKRTGNCRRNALVLALSAALLIPLGAVAQTATGAARPPDPPQQTTNKGAIKAQNLKKVVVLGSLIPRTEIEGAAPVQTITGEQIKAEGYTTFFQFLQSLPQTSGNSDFYNRPSTWGNTAVNARTVDLRGIGPQFTLLMVDGIPVVSYPMPENATFGHFEIQNAANIPLGMIDRVQVLATGASAMYGSQAMAGVINVILKKKYQGDDLRLKVGGDTRGGQRLGDFMWTGGRSGKNWHIVYNFEHKNRSALWGRNRPGYDNVSDAGFGAWNTNDRLFGYQYDKAGATGVDMTGADGRYITPPPGSCEAFAHFKRAESKSIATSGNKVTGPITDNGTYCAMPEEFRNWVLEPGIRDNDFYIGGDYQFTPTLDAYGSAAVYLTHGWSNTTLPGYGFGTPFYDAGSGQIITGFGRQFTPAELGGMANTHDNEKYWDLRAGLKNGFSGRFNWNLQFGSQKYIVHELYTASNVTAIQNFFLGQQKGTKTINGTTYPVYDLNQKALWYPFTPSQYQTFAAHGEDSAMSQRNDATFNIATDDLVDIPWDSQSVGWAAVVEADRELYKLSPDPQLSSTFENPFGDDNHGEGSREHYALGTEFSVPVMKSVTWDIAGRIDKYHDASIADIARTWKTGIEWRPIPILLFRGTFGTNFKAPGMNAIYLTGSSATVGDYADPLQCIKANEATCNDFQHPTSEYFTNNSGGDRNLLPMTGQSMTYGFVLDIPHVQGLSVQADYWRDKIKDEIEWIGLGQALNDEAGCRTGLQVGGAPYTAHTIGSAYCKEAIANVHRNAAGGIVSVDTGPINESFQEVSGVDAAVHYTLLTNSMGSFRFGLHWTDNLTWYSRTKKTDPLLNTRYQHVASRMTASLAWMNGPWNVTVYGLRWGEVRANNFNGCEVLPNGIQPTVGAPGCVRYKQFIAPWYIFSTTVGYRFNKSFQMSLNVVNMFDKMPTIPYYAGGFEFVSGEQGDGYTGRQVYLNVNYKFD